MNGKLLVCLVFVAALAVTVHGDCTACTSKATAYTGAKTAEDICKLGKEYVDCLDAESCNTGLDAAKKALETNSCNSAGTLAFSMTCLFLSVLLNKLIN